VGVGIDDAVSVAIGEAGSWGAGGGAADKWQPASSAAVQPAARARRDRIT
jgi:hypothetical protein